MAVAFDAATESVRLDTSDPYTFTHTPVGTPRGVVVTIVHGTESTDLIAGVTYGGVNMTRIATATDTATEPGRAYLYFVGRAVPSGAQTVSVDITGASTTDMQIVAVTLTATTSAVGVLDSDLINDNVANPSLTLQYGGSTGIAIAALYGGGAAPTSFTPNANCTTVASEDLGAFYAYVLRQTTPGTADFAIGGTAATDDVAYVAAAFAEQIDVSLTAPPAAATGGIGSPDGVDVTVGPSPAAATASVVAPQAGSFITTVVSPAAGATAAVSSPVPGLTVPAAVGAATAASVAPTPGLTVSAVATATASVSAPSFGGDANVTAAVAAATAAGLAPTPALTLGPAAANAPADGLAPLIDTGAAGITIIPPAAAATAGIATPDGVDVTIGPEAANADAGTNGSPVVTTSSGGENVISAPPAVAYAVAQEQDPFPFLEAMGPPTPTIIVTAQATATAAGLAPTPLARVVVPAASATASSVAPVVGPTIVAPVATATASAVAPSVPGGAGNILIGAVVATATATALSPLPLLVVPVTTSAATAAALVPSPGVRMAPTAAAATAAVATPTPNVTIVAAVATASTSAAGIVNVPSSVIITSSAASATASVATVTVALNLVAPAAIGGLSLIHPTPGDPGLTISPATVDPLTLTPV